MQSLKVWEDKMKEKRKNTPWREFLKEIASWRPLTFYKNGWLTSRYPSSNRINISSNDDYNKDYDSFTNFWINYDFDVDFFKNFKKIFLATHLPTTINFVWTENSEYADQVYSSKNVYLSNVIVVNCENVLYSFNTKWNCKNILNSSNIINNCENIYNSFWVISSYNVFYSHFINNSNNIWFSSNLTWCSECIFCEELENQKYCIANKIYSKEEYYEKKKEFSDLKSQFWEFYKNVNKIWKNYNTKKVSWNYIIESENVENGYIVSSIKNWRNLLVVSAMDMTENMYDICAAWWLPTNDFYGVVWWGWGSNVYNSCHMPNDSNIYYSYFLENCSFCFWCIGLKNKSFCILNKQYSKEEWYDLADKIFASMEKDAILGKFFPWEFNPFYFNDTMAYLIDDSFSKEEIEKAWYMWRDEKIKVDIPEWAEVVYTKNPPVLSDIPLIKGDSQSGAEFLEITPPARSSLPPQSRGTQGGVLSDYQGFDENGNWKINPEILKKVIIDNDGNYYKIVPMEYDFLMKYGLPLPEVHWLERIKMGFKI